MSADHLIVFKGAKSQTGLATRAEFPGVAFSGAKEGFDEIGDILKTNKKCAILPIWNSHDGEIRASGVLSLLFERNARLYRLWPSLINWHLIEKPGKKTTKKVVSVVVAESQCSSIIEKEELDFVAKESTVDAYSAFKTDLTLSYALLAPGQNESFNVVTDAAANPLNFTTFGLLGGQSTGEWGDKEWSWLWEVVNKPRAREALYFGIETAVPTDFSQGIGIMDSLAGEINKLEEIPTLLLAARSLAGRCRLLFESRHPVEELPAGEEGYGDLKPELVPDIGETSETYISRIEQIMHDRFNDPFQGKDFVCHRGTQTCFFACPPLGIMTHGFDPVLIEALVKQLIGVFYTFYLQGVSGRDDIMDCLKRHEADFNDLGTEAIKFVEIGGES